MHVVWLPMLPRDDRAAAQASTSKVLAGVGHVWWDGDRTLGRAWGPVLGLGESKPAWDVYLVFGPDARWDADAAPPVPVTWWHQLSGAPPVHRAGPTLAGDLAQALEALVAPSPTR